MSPPSHNIRGFYARFRCGHIYYTPPPVNIIKILKDAEIKPCPCCEHGIIKKGLAK